MMSLDTPMIMKQLGQEPLAIIGHCPDLTAAVQMAEQVALTSMPILVVGETGTGKELLARLIHKRSRRPGELVAVNCAAVPGGLFESVVFGHRRGSFTGAIDDAPGLVDVANNGTLFLDELTSLSSHRQSKLLRVLETGEVHPVGDPRPHPVSFRLVATAQPDLAVKLDKGRFRDDLLQRVAGVVVRLPALRNRGDDVRLLARWFAERRGLRLDAKACDMLARRDWPGNVRELKYCIGRAALFAKGGTIDVINVEAAWEIGPAQLHSASIPTPVHEGLGQLRALCERYRGNAERIAGVLGIGRSTLYRRLKHAGIRLDGFRPQPGTQA